MNDDNNNQYEKEYDAELEKALDKRALEHVRAYRGA